MKAISTQIQGGLAVLGLVAAYFTWQRPPETQQKNSVTMFEASKSALEKVRYTDGTRAVAVERKDRLMVSYAFEPGKRPEYDAGTELETIDAGVDGGAVVKPRPPPPPPDRTVYANERAETVWGRVQSFEATRALGRLGDEKESELGLTGSERVLELTKSGATTRFIVSKPVSGVVGSYTKNAQTGEVFLVPTSVFNDLDPNSQVLIDRRLHTFKLTDFDSFTVSADGKSATYTVEGAQAPATMRISPVATPDKPDELLKNWHERLWNRLVVSEVLERDELPKAGTPEVVLRIEYTRKGNQTGWLEIGSVGGTSWWARTENTASWVQVNQSAEDVAIEGRKLAL